MRVNALKIRNFRNYEALDLSFDKDCNIIFGENAQGKTNILEAIYLCAAGRSHRTSKDNEMVRMHTEGYSIFLDIEKEKQEINIEIKYYREGKKSIKINEIPAKKLGNLIGNLNAVIFSPEDLMIIKDGPSERRRFMDITISQLKPSYFYDLQQYGKILMQRNSLLKEIQLKRTLEETLDVWDEHLIKTGARIIKARKEFVEKINIHAKENHEKITNGKEKLYIGYECSFKVKNWGSIDNIEECFERSLKGAKERELVKGTTTYGPQRDDCCIILNETDIRIYGSQGQQRTAVLSMKLSEIDIMKDETGENPVLLLDDVMSELDMERQDYLLRNLEKVQTFITCTDKEYFGKINDVRTGYFHVVNGSVI